MGAGCSVDSWRLVAAGAQSQESRADRKEPKARKGPAIRCHDPRRSADSSVSERYRLPLDFRGDDRTTAE
jgi:hypothetical protein